MLDCNTSSSMNNNKHEPPSERRVSFEPVHWISQQELFATQPSAPRMYPVGGGDDAIRSALRVAGEINRAGAAALAAGSILKASECFRSALEHLEFLHVNLQQLYFEEQGGSRMAMATNIASVRAPLDVDEVDVIGCHDDYLYVYRKAFNFLPDVLERNHT